MARFVPFRPEENGRFVTAPFTYSFLVVPSNVFVDGLFEFCEGLIGILQSVVHFVLHHAEERFHYAVVAAIALPRHGLANPPGRQLCRLFFVHVLPPLVGMEYQLPQIRMGIERLFQYPGDLGHVRVERKFARDDFAREHVFDRAEVAFAHGKLNWLTSVVHFSSGLEQEKSLLWWTVPSFPTHSTKRSCGDFPAPLL